MIRYLLDTNILSDLIRHPQGKVFEKIRNEGEQSIFTSIIVASELRFGALKKGSPQLSERVDILLNQIEILGFDNPADKQYAIIRTHLEKNGSLIGPNDLLIAAHALQTNSILVSANLKEFNRVPKLTVENWL